MGRRNSKNGDADGAQAPAPAKHGNGYDPDKVKNAVDRIENLQGDIRKIMMEALTECKAVHGDIKEVYQEAKDEAGIPKKALKSVIKARALERKAAEAREALEPDVQDQFDLLRHALGELGETPLGQAALRQTMAQKMREPGAPLDPANGP